MSLRTRILLLVLLATIAPAAVFGLYFVNERERNIAEAEQQLRGLARYATENLDDRVRGTVQLLHGLSRARDLETTDKRACSEFLAGVLARFPQYTGLLTITPDGDLHCDSLRTGRSLNLSQRGYFKKVHETMAPAFEVVMGGLTGIAVLQVAYPVVDAAGKLRFLLLASLNLSEYAEAVAAASPSRGIRLLIWDRKGVLLVGAPEIQGPKIVGRDGSASELFRFAASGDVNAAATLPDPRGLGGVWALGVMPEPRGGGARLVLGMSPDMLRADADRELRNALLMLIAVSALAFAAAWYVAETGIRRHVGTIAKVAKRIGKGDLGARGGPPYPRGELGELMQVVDRTAESVEAQQAEIVSRSRDLQEVNRVLRVFSGINTLIVRVRDRGELFREACRITVEEGGYCMAMVAILDRGAMKLVPIASAGMDDGFLAALADLFAADDTASTTLVARAVRERKAVVCNASQTDPQVFLRTRHVEAGIRSFAVLPLVVAGEPVGVLAVYARETGHFDSGEMKLLTGLADDIAFAIDHLDKQERLDYLAYHDALTGLANRTRFLERLTQRMREATSAGHKLAVLVVDLERFKHVNDSLGRTAGDALLGQVAQWLVREMGDADLVARVAADHFAMILPRVRGESDAAERIERAIEAFRNHPFHLNDAVFRVAVKVGVALYPADGTDADALFRNAEAALRKAKASGDRYLFYAQKMTEAVAGKLVLENQLRQAIDNGEFVLHYQPKVNLASGELAGAEALIRWNDPRTGLVPPMRFIPILEETGLIREVGRWAVRKAIDDYLRWRAAGLPAVRIAVNVSALQLRHRDFVAEIAQAVGVHPLAAAGLELEITESVIMEDITHNTATLEAIRALGVTVALDDFGTGFSSLGYLARLPVDALKIDRSFVVGMTTGSRGLALVSTIVGLAHALGLKVVAEGVENPEQSRLLLVAGCDEMQGYLHSRPVPSGDFESRFLAAPGPERLLQASR